jgi:MMP 1-O-methyltransferase
LTLPRWRTVARQAKGFMPDDEGMALFGAAAEAARAQLGPVVEIGTYCAKSAVYLGAGARYGQRPQDEDGRQAGRGQGRKRPGPRRPGPAPERSALVFTVDHHRGSEELQPGWAHHDPAVVDVGTGVVNTLPWARRTLAAAGLDDIVELVVGESTAVARTWPGPVGLLFIDGGHGQDVAWADYHAWVPKVAAGGGLAVHDVFADPGDGGQVPYDLWRHALGSGHFDEVGETGSLRLLRRSRQL